MSNVTPIRPNDQESPETVTLRFRQGENQMQPDLLIVALKYLFEAVEQRIEQAPGDEEADIGASYLAMAGAELAQSLSARQVD